MARPFNVTAAADSVRLDAQGRGATTYTVSNISGRARRGRARLVPGDPAQGSWLSVEGEAERDFTADGTQQYVVKIAVPPGTPAGKFTFGLDVVSVENPDEEFTQGPKVAFEVAPPAKKKPFPWWIIAVIAALLVVGGLVAWLLHRKPAEPDRAPLQASCTADAGCADGLFCAKEGTAASGVCLGKVGFAACRTTRDCADGTACDSGTCRGSLRFASCQKDGDCLTGLTCSGNKCVGPKGFNGCALPTDCATNLCINGSCTDRTTMASCTDNAGCAPGESCVSVGSAKLCLRQTGQTCTQPLECVSRNCAGGTCQAGTTSCLTSADCASPYQCSGQICVLPNGQHCSGNLQCQSGNCEGGTCQSKICRTAADCGAFGLCDSTGHCKVRVWLRDEILLERVSPGIPGIKISNPGH
jgi:hypothetical protein